MNESFVANFIPVQSDITPVTLLIPLKALPYILTLFFNLLADSEFPV